VAGTLPVTMFDDELVWATRGEDTEGVTELHYVRAFGSVTLLTDEGNAGGTGCSTNPGIKVTE